MWFVYIAIYYFVSFFENFEYQDMTEKTEENVYYCCNCTHKTTGLYKKYSPTVLKLIECVSSNFTL